MNTNSHIYPSGPLESRARARSRTRVTRLGGATWWFLFAGSLLAGALACWVPAGGREGEQHGRSLTTRTFEPVPPGQEAPSVRLRRDSAQRVTFPDDTEVVGVSAGGEDRAYILRTLAPISQHVVNDSFGDLPVSITYCPMRDCLRVFVGEAGGEPLGLRPSGYAMEGGMVLDHQGELFYQESGNPFGPPSGRRPPLREIPHTRTTWKAWKEQHPTTEVIYYPSLTCGSWGTVYPRRRVKVPADAPVVGVTFRGKARAYLLAAFNDAGNYVLTDSYGGAALAVAYCARSGEATVYAGPDPKPPPYLTFGGWDARSPDGDMLLAIGGDVYLRKTGEALDGETTRPFPCREIPSLSTSWGEWVAAHPDTNLYIGHQYQYLRFSDGGDAGTQLLGGFAYVLPFIPAFLLLVGLLRGRFLSRRRPLEE
jgi:hypothetical protein